MNIQEILNQISKLYQAREILLKNKLAPKGAWIHEYVVSKRLASGEIRYYLYAKWQANEPIFECCPKGKNKGKLSSHKHIGAVYALGHKSLEADEAYEVWDNTLTLEAIENTLEKINLALTEFSKFTLPAHEKILDEEGKINPSEKPSKDAETVLNTVLKNVSNNPEYEFRYAYRKKLNYRIRKLSSLYKKK